MCQGRQLAVQCKRRSCVANTVSVSSSDEKEARGLLLLLDEMKRHAAREVHVHGPRLQKKQQLRLDIGEISRLCVFVDHPCRIQLTITPGPKEDK